jgi:hypothetical protein
MQESFLFHIFLLKKFQPLLYFSKVPAFDQKK